MKFQYIDLVKGCEIDMTDVHPFVFKHWGKAAEEIDVDVDNTTIKASPFPKFTIEVDNGFVSQGRPGDEYNVCMAALYCEEVAPNVYDFALRTRTTVKGEHHWKNVWIKHDDDTLSNGLYNELITMTNLYIERMHSQYMGHVNGSGKVKYQARDGKRKVYKPTNIIYVTNKPKTFNHRVENQPKTARGQYVRHTGITHVIPHWRKLVNPLSLGIGRDGVRNVLGQTFIKTHTRGDGEEVTKVRKIM